MKQITITLQIGLIISMSMSFDLMAITCSKKITRFWGLGNCDDHIAILMKCASNIVDMNDKKNTESCIKKIRGFNNFLVSNTNQFGLGFDAIVRIFNDLNKNGVKNGTCKIAKHSVWNCNYTNFVRDFFDCDGDGYYRLLDRIKDQAAKKNLNEMASEIEWKKSLDNSSYLIYR